ncbi:MAG TPA: flagellar basal body rod protein FlgB [Pirellulaceae bacterium]|nr:flagellar basal body rod protein FlgB [Pirellulaceae bacterium]HMO92879.1 flagellar basal body rod protein FlgB [Pirellulaceae bacterium]HMP71088.1 flagellar basal body rod protein FlgB [Pirellulaceae bacterium]
MNLNSYQIPLLSRAIEFASQNHRVISQNLANVNTPNYQTQEIPFAQFLQHVEQPGNLSKDKELKLEALEVQGLKTRHDGNNVDLDREMANIKRNDLMYQTLTQLIGSKLATMKQAIKG